MLATRTPADRWPAPVREAQPVGVSVNRFVQAMAEAAFTARLVRRLAVRR